MQSSKHLLWIILILFTSSCGGSDESGTNKDMDDDPADDLPIDTISKTEAFSITSLKEESQSSAQNPLTFLAKQSMSSHIYLLTINDQDERTTSANDEVYYIYEGEGEISINEETSDISAGHSVFIPKEQKREITSISQDFTIIITSLNQRSVGNTAAHQISSHTQSQTGRNPNSNIWNPFFNKSSVIFGLYMLPQSLNGDGRLVHGWDELNIVSAGSCRFNTNDKRVAVTNGSIIYVAEGNGHFFDNLTRDTDIFILWDQ